MKIETSRFGTVEITEEQIFTFPMGLLGFAKYKQFVVIDHTEESPFKWLQSVEEGSLAFIITDPLFLWPIIRSASGAPSYRCWMFRVKRIWSSQ